MKITLKGSPERRVQRWKLDAEVIEAEGVGRTSKRLARILGVEVWVVTHEVVPDPDFEKALTQMEARKWNG